MEIILLIVIVLQEILIVEFHHKVKVVEELQIVIQIIMEEYQQVV